MSKPAPVASANQPVSAAPSASSSTDPAQAPTPTAVPKPFNYAAAARAQSSNSVSGAASRPGSGAVTPNLASSVATASSSSAPSPAPTPALPQSSFAAAAGGFGGSNAASPLTSQPLSKAGSSTETQPNGVTGKPGDRRASAVGVPKGHGVKPSASGISFGSLADPSDASEAVLSSSPANPPTLTRRDVSLVFGSVDSAATSAPAAAGGDAAAASTAPPTTTTTAPTPVKKEGKKKYDFNAGFQQPAAPSSMAPPPTSSTGSPSPSPSANFRPDSRRGASTYDPSNPSHHHSNPTSPRPGSAAHLGPPPPGAGFPGAHTHLSGASQAFTPGRPSLGGPQNSQGYPMGPGGWQHPSQAAGSPHFPPGQLPGLAGYGPGGPAPQFLPKGPGGTPNFNPRNSFGPGPQGGPQGPYGQGGRPQLGSQPSQNGGRGGNVGPGPTSPRLPQGGPNGAPQQGFGGPGMPPYYSGQPGQQPVYGQPFPYPYNPNVMPTYPNPNAFAQQHHPHPSSQIPGLHQNQGPPGSATPNSRPDMLSRASSAMGPPASPAVTPATPGSQYSSVGPVGPGGPPSSFGSNGPPQQQTPHGRTPSLSLNAPSFTPNAGASEFKPNPAAVAFTPRKSAAIQIKKPTGPPPTKAGPPSAVSDKEKADKEAEEQAAKEKLEAEEKAKKEAEEKERVEAELKRKEEEEAAAAAAKKKAEEEAAAAEAKQKAEEEEAARVKAEEEKRRAEEEAEKKRKEEEAAAAEKARLEQEAKEKAEREAKEAEAKVEAERKEREAKEKAEGETAEADKENVGDSTSSLPDPASLPGLPSKPVNGVAATPAKTRPSPIDVTSPARTPAGADAAPTSATPSALQSARKIEDLSQVTYPDNILSPRSELNTDATPGKFRYDREFLLQFMGICREKPDQLPSLEAIGMTDASDSFSPGAGFPRTHSSTGQRRGPSGAAPPLARGASGSASPMGAPIRMGSGTMPMFGAPARTSEERFAQATMGRGVMGGMPIGGAFNMPGRPGGMSRPPSVAGLAAGRPTDRRSGSGRARGQKGGTPLPPTGPDAAPLQVSANSWGAARNKDGQLDEDSPEMVQRKVKALLNKLTLDKFDSISDQVLAWANKSEKEKDGRILRQVIALIFEKATDEAHWSSMYASLCRKLMEMLSPQVQDENVRDGQGNPVAGGQLFRKYLLNRCQEDYERGWSRRDELVQAAADKAAEDNAKISANEQSRADAEASGKEEPKEAELLSDEYYAAQKAKRQGLGLVRFIGELFKLAMLTERIMHECIKKLLANIEEPEEEDVESLCRLMTTVGKLLDHDKAHKHLDIYFTRMASLAKNQKLSSRARFMVQDVIEARNNGWRVRNEAAGPKLTAEIREEAIAAQAEASRASQQRGMPRLNDQMPRGGSRGGQQRSQFGGVPSADGWSQVSGAPPPRPSKAGDLSHFGKIRDASASGKPTFGPTGIFANKGRRDGKATPERDAAVSVAANPFAALTGDTAPAEPPASLSRRTSQADLASSTASSRPKLNLAPRTLPIRKEGEEGDEKEEGEEDEEEAMSDETANRMIKNSVEEFFNVKSVDEAVASFEALPTSRRHQLATKIAEKAIDKKLPEVQLTSTLFGKLAEGLVSADDFSKAFEPIVINLEDTGVDNPSAFKFTGLLLKGAALDEAAVKALSEKMEEMDEPLEEIQARLIDAFNAS